jgi:TatD DNase family protein
MNLTDTHTHLNDPKFEPDLNEVISRARNAGVEMMVVCGFDMPSSWRAVEIAEAYAGICATVGVHPHDSKSFLEGDLRVLRELSSTDKVIAIGEIGLDFHYDFSPRADQVAAFQMQLDLANNLGLPAVIHSRESHMDTVAMIRSAGTTEAVFHYFSEDEDAAREVLDMGFYVGVDGPVTYKNSETLRRVVEACPLDRLLIETDCPYSAPVPHRGRRNEPAFVGLVCQEVARVKKISPEEAAEATSANARRLFRRMP